MTRTFDGYPAPPPPPPVQGATQAMAYRTPYMQPVPAPQPPRRRSFFRALFDEQMESWRTGRPGSLMMATAAGRWSA